MTCPGPLRWSKRWAGAHPFYVWFLTVMVILVVTVGTGAHFVRRIDAESKARVAANNRQTQARVAAVEALVLRIEKEKLDRDAALCKTSVDIRTVIRDLVTSSTAGFDLTQLESVKRASPDVRAIFAELQELTSSSTGPNAARREANLRKVPIPDCGPPLSP